MKPRQIIPVALANVQYRVESSWELLNIVKNQEEKRVLLIDKLDNYENMWDVWLTSINITAYCIKLTKEINILATASR